MGWLLVFARDDDAATAVEYAVMLALIIVVCIGAISALSQNASGMWSSNETSISTALGSSS